jgi:hypothetical protein
VYLMMDAEKYFESEERLEIEELLEAEKGLWGPKEIAEALGKKPATIRWLMTKMIEGENARVVRHSHGKYCHITSPHYKESELGSDEADQSSLELEDDSWDEKLVGDTNTTNFEEERSLSSKLGTPPTPPTPPTIP